MSQKSERQKEVKFPQMLLAADSRRECMEMRRRGVMTRVMVD